MFDKILHNRWLRTLALLAGSFLAAWTVNTFIVPQHFYNGGILGLCQVIRSVLDQYLGIRVTQVDLAGALYLIANIPLLILAWFSLGRTFVWKLILCTVTNSLFMLVIPVPEKPLIEDVLSSCLIGGILNGAANGLMLTCGGSAGGMDIVGLYLSKKRGMTVGRMAILFNIGLYALCLLLFNVTTAIYSAVFSVINSVVVDRVHQQNITVQALIITKHKDRELSDYIISQINRGVTYWDGHGAYTGDDVRILCVCLSKYEIEPLREQVKKIDPHAFIMVQEGVSPTGNFQRHLT